MCRSMAMGMSLRQKMLSAVIANCYQNVQLFFTFVDGCGPQARSTCQAMAGL
jgi:hypothetical protein